MSGEPSGALWGALGGLGGILVTAVFAWLTQRSKGQVEESVSVRAEWEKLTSSLSQRLTAVEREFAEYRTQTAKEMAELRKHHADEMDEMRRQHRAEMRAMRELNEGLQRQIAQNSQSTAQMLGTPDGVALTKAAQQSRGEGESE